MEFSESKIAIIFLVLVLGIYIQSEINNDNIFDHPTPTQECNNEFGENNWTVQCIDWINVAWEYEDEDLYWSNNSHNYWCVAK